MEPVPVPEFLPTDFVPVVRINPNSRQRELVPLRWGLIPSSAIDPAASKRMLHARAETVATKPSFRGSFRYQRCLVVVDTFDIGKSQSIQRKDRRPFGVGAIWDRWEKEGSDPVESCAVITMAANALVQPINDRMPVIIAEDDYGRWLDPEFYDLDELERMMRSFPADEFVVVPS